MATYCDCGAIATHFYDECGNEIEPCCDECHEYQLEMVAEMFGE